MPKTQDPDTEIEFYFHCRMCLEEKPDGVSPREWNRTETGVLKSGRIRIWCIRHNTLVGDWPPMEPEAKA